MGKERVFGENGETVEETEIPEAEQPQQEERGGDLADPEENQDPDPDVVSEAAAPKSASATTHKYRIGDKTFATQAEAISYAESQTQVHSEVDAYRQVLREVVASAPRGETVTRQPVVEENAEELYTNPNEYMRKRDERIRQEVLSQVNQSQASREADERIWLEFRERHPDLADFREDVTALAGRNSIEVQSVIKTKGQAAGYDYVATKFKAQAERLASAIKPKRALPNTGSGAPAGVRTETVTSKIPPKKLSTMAEQIRTMRKGRI